MDAKTFLMAVDIYRANGGKSGCSPNQSCEGETPDVVILKDFDGHPVAEVKLSTSSRKELASSSGSKSGGQHPLADSRDDLGAAYPSKSGWFCYVVASLTVVGGFVVAQGNTPLGLGLAGSSAPIFAVGSVAHNVKRMARRRKSAID